MKKLNKLIEYLFYLFLFLLPWQARLIIKEGILNGGHWEWGTYSLYAIDIIFILVLILFCFKKIFYLEKDASPLPKKIFFLIFFFVLYCFLSIFWSVNNNLAFYWWLRFLQGVILFIFVQKIDFNITKACWSLVFSGLIQIGLAAHQLITQEVFSSKWLGMAAQNPFQAGTSVVETIEGRILRLYGGFSHPNIFAGFLIFLIFILLLLYLYSKKFWQRGFILFFSSLITMILYLTYSRAAWIVLLVNFIFFTVIIFKKAPKNFRTPFFEFFGLILIIFVMFSCLTLRDFIVRIEAIGRLENISINERISNFERGTELAQKNFEGGVGLGNYTLALFNQYSDLSSWEYQPVANIYLLILTELGFIGLVLFLITIGFIFVHFGFNIYSPLFLSFLLLGFFDHWIFSLSSGILLFWLALGLLWKKGRIYELTN